MKESSETLIKSGDFGTAVFSPCENYRYSLRVEINFPNGRSSRCCSFIGLNPSTADHNAPDPTVKRCLRWATKWGFDSFVMLNAFAYRATDPENMKSQRDPVGQMNDAHLQVNTLCSDRVVVCWGNHGGHMGRQDWILINLRTWNEENTFCFGRTGRGYPKHPLYLRNDTPLERWWV